MLPGSTKFLIDNVIGHKDFEMLRLLLIVVGLSTLVQAATSFLLTQLLSVEAQLLIARMRVQIQQHIIFLPTRFFDNNKSGALVSRIMNDVEGVRNLVGTGLLQLIGGILTAIASLFLLIKISPQMTLFASIPLVIFTAISLKAFAYIRPIFRERGLIQADVTGRLTETLGGIRVIKGFNAEAREIETFQSGTDRIFQNIKKTLMSTSLVSSLATLLLGLSSVMIMGIGGTLIMKDHMTVGDFFAFTMYLGFLVAPVLQMSSIGTQLTEAFAGLDRMDEILKIDREGSESGRVRALDQLDGQVTFEDVWFAYEADKPAVNGISFVAPAGSVTALVGSSGAGKSTVAGLVATFLTPTKGMIRIDGIDLASIKLDSYRNRLGVVLQDEFLFEGTIRENVLFPRPQAGEARLLDAIKAAHVDEFTNRFEKGLDTLIGERGVKLSGGQRQRLAIARAILADPKILILDEATSNLDTESEAFIQDSLAQLMKGRTTFVIAHRLSTIRRADQILVIEGGQIVESGNHDALLAKQGRYYQLYNYQARI